MDQPTAEQQPQRSVTADFAYAQVISRQRDEASNTAARLEVQLAIALQDNGLLKEQLEQAVATIAEQNAKVAGLSANRAQRRAKQKG